MPSHDVSFLLLRFGLHETLGLESLLRPGRALTHVKLATALMLLVTASAPEDKSTAQGHNTVSIRANLIIKSPLYISIKQPYSHLASYITTHPLEKPITLLPFFLSPPG